MTNPTVLVWGHGSIGARHARLADELGASVICVSSREGLPFPSVRRLGDLPGGFAPEVVVVATPTALHAEHLHMASNLGARLVLVEKPLVSTTEEIGSWLAQEQRQRIAVAYNLRFHPAIQRLRTLLEGKRLLALHLHVGQYLPSWRPGQDYRQSYSSSRQLGGGVLRDLSHELDLACMFAGPWNRVAALSGRVSHLQIESEDSVTVLAEHAGCPQVSIHLDYLQTPARREIVAVLEDGGVSLNLLNGKISCGGREELCQAERDTTYRGQMRAVLLGQTELLCTFSQGLEVVSYIDAIEAAAARQEWIWRANQ